MDDFVDSMFETAEVSDELFLALDFDPIAAHAFTDFPLEDESIMSKLFDLPDDTVLGGAASPILHETEVSWHDDQIRSLLEDDIPITSITSPQNFDGLGQRDSAQLSTEISDGTKDKALHQKPENNSVSREKPAGDKASIPDKLQGTNRRRARLACVACRKRKTRCTGEQPCCLLCRNSRQPCVYMATTTRRAHALPRRGYMAMVDKCLKRMESRIITKVIMPKTGDVTANIT